MDLVEEVVRLVETVAALEPSLAAAGEAFDLNRADVLSDLRAGRDPRRRLAERALTTGTNEMGIAEITAVLNLITLAWKTYEVLKSASQEAKRTAEAARRPHPAAEQLWREILERDAKLPPNLAQTIASRHASDLARLLSDG